MQPTGVEALIRWRSRERGLVQPVDFIPLLEETGLIVEVGRWVLAQACRQGTIWHERGLELGVAVNVSARQLETDEFVADVREALADSGLPARALTLEITETALMRNPEQTARRLRAIKDLGARVAIDDFGTGYSSFAHLKQFPVDALKIDRSFISQMNENPEGETLLRTLATAARRGRRGHVELRPPSHPSPKSADSASARTTSSEAGTANASASASSNSNAGFSRPASSAAICLRSTPAAAASCATPMPRSPRISRTARPKASSCCCSR
jgi:hypothetical protein